MVADPESFLVDKETHLEHHEIERARSWGQLLWCVGTFASTTVAWVGCMVEASTGRGRSHVRDRR